MTKGQQIVLTIVIIMLIGVTGLLAVTLITSEQAAPPTRVPTLALQPTVTATQPPDTPTPFTVPPTWTSEPTRTSPPTNTPQPTHTARPLPTISPTFAPTFTPRPTPTPTLPGPTQTVELENPGFEGIRADSIPGWGWRAEDNFAPGGNYDPDTSYDTPLFKLADDAARIISGQTLQVDATQHLKFKVHIFQTLPVSPTTTIGFQVMAGAFSDTGAIRMAAGIDPDGGPDCSNAQWSDIVSLDQVSGVQPIAAPQVEAGDAGQVTVCLYAEPQYAALSNAAFFDDAELIVNPEE